MTGYVNAEAAEQSGEHISFSFGANWMRLVEHLSEGQVKDAEMSLSVSFKGASLRGATVLDLGCGSGLFSLAALSLGAAQVVSVDADPDAVACAKLLRQRAGSPRNWSVHLGSVLDPEFVASLPKCDRLLCWGVLHHTGAMWTGFELALTRLAPGGLACVALYNRPRWPWVQLQLKRLYNHAPNTIRALMRVAYGIAWLTAAMVLRRSNPIAYTRDYGKDRRGMSFWRDVEDWLGGLPWEYTDPAQVEFALREGMTLEHVLIRPPGACNEYLIRRDQ